MRTTTLIYGTLMALNVTAAEAAEFLRQKPEVPKLLWREPEAPSVPRYLAKEWLPGCRAYVGERSNIWWGGASFCANMVAGIARTANALGVCIDVPSGITLQQAVRIIIRYIEARPQRTDEGLIELAIEAAHDSWPCSSSK